MRHPLTISAVALLTLLGGANASLQSPAAPPKPRLAEGSLAYRGAFTVPESDGTGGDMSFGGLLGLGAEGKTLFWNDHAWTKGVCEVSIPEIGGRAAIVQRCTEIDEGLLKQISPGAEDTSVQGVLAWNGRLIYSATSYYDASANARYSHFVSGPSFATAGDARGPYRVGSKVPPAAAGGYFGVIPEEWRSAFGGPVLTGNCCLSIISRTSSGPAVSVFDPDDLGRVTPVPSSALLFYPMGNQLAPDQTRNPLFNQTTQIATVLFPAGSSSVLFVGRHGTGDFCYGDGSECPDPTNGNKGGHAYPYVHQVWAYDANDLLKVKRDDWDLWQPKPYATWRLTGMDSSGGATVSGGTYDPRAKRLYIAQSTGGGPQTVHVFDVTVPADDNNRAVPRRPPGSPGADPASR